MSGRNVGQRENGGRGPKSGGGALIRSRDYRSKQTGVPAWAVWCFGGFSVVRARLLWVAVGRMCTARSLGTGHLAPSPKSTTPNCPPSPVKTPFT